MNPRSLISALLLFILTLPCKAQDFIEAESATDTHVIDSLRASLRSATTPIDSLHILNDLFDALPRRQSTAIGDTVCALAMRIGQYDDALDVIRNQANRYMRSDSMLHVLTERAMQCPDTPDRLQTLTLIKMLDNVRRANYTDADTRLATIREYLTRVQNLKGDDLYERVALTHGICLMLSNEPNANLLLTYVDSLTSLVNRLPPNAVALRSAFNIHVASMLASSHPEKSMAADMRSLNDLRHLKRYYADKGREFRKFASPYYTIYTRLLSNFSVLDSAKVEEYYNNAMAQIPADNIIKNYYEAAPYPDIYRYMFFKEYAKALPLIKKVLDDGKHVSYIRRTKLLRFEIECAQALGDKTTELQAYRDYSDALYDELLERTNGAFRELKTAYALYDMKYELAQAEAQQRASMATMQKKVLITTILASGFLAIMVVVLFFSYRKNRRLAHDLKASNERLIQEGEKLRQSRAELIRARDRAQKANNLKGDFIKNMTYEVKVPLQAINEYSHLIADCVSGTDGNVMVTSLKHLGHFADLVEFNSELLNTIIDDVFRLSEIESDSMPLHPQVINLKSLCEGAITSVEHRVLPGVNIRLAPGLERLDLFADPIRVQQVLNNMLTNAAKFTHDGSIIVDYKLDENTDRVEISVTDTGIGINPENKEKIFDRFVKLDRDSQGAGLGLTIARLIARHMGGELALDTSYTGSGARFVFTLPRRA